MLETLEEHGHEVEVEHNVDVLVELQVVDDVTQGPYGFLSEVVGSISTRKDDVDQDLVLSDRN